jgi:DNA-directed RNA polymerase subunit RPC12/RpoP
MTVATEQYRCEKCGTTFESQEELQQHASRSHSATGGAGGSYRCDACGSGFGSQEELEKHAQAEH